MSDVIPLPDEDISRFADIVSRAYPGFTYSKQSYREETIERLRTMQHEEPSVTFYGLYRDDELLGGMRVHNFHTNVRSTMINAGGVGLVAVDLIHKREHVCKELLEHFLAYCRTTVRPLAMLYPFRPDFYKRMGFGFGPLLNRYSLSPAALPASPQLSGVRYMRPEDRDALVECSRRYVREHHGMVDKSDHEVRQMLATDDTFIACHWDGEVMDGYVYFRFARGHTSLVNDIEILEFAYLTKDAFRALLSFLNRQSDQVRRIHFNTHDDFLHFVVDDPRDGTDDLLHPISHPTRRSGVGLMYRVVDAQLMFDVLGSARFGPGDCSVKIEPDDSFLPDNTAPVAMTFRNGRVSHCKCGVDVTVRLGIAELSSLLMGTVTFSKLRSYGLIGMSDPSYTDVLNAIFGVEEGPQCATSF